MSKVTEEAYDEWLDELGESALTGYSAAWLFKRADSIAYQLGLNEYTDELEEECRPTPPDFEPCFTEREMEDIYDEMLEDSLGLDWLADRYSISWLIKRADPTAYRVGFNDYEDMMTEDNEAEGFDTEYNFVMSDIGEADERVEEKLDDGWKLYGDPVVFEKQDFTVFGQGMTKDAETFRADPLLQAIKDREKARNAGTVKLQGMPRTKGTKAEDVKVGDVLVWNQGGTSQVMSITPKGKQSLLWKTRTEDGREWERTVRKNRLVVVARPNGWVAKKYADMKSESFPKKVEIKRSTNPEKKLMAVFEDEEGKKVKTTHFGQRGASDYTKHGDKERMKRYLERHGGGTTTSTKENWKDPTTAGSLSRWVLWNKPSLSGSFSDYKRRFGLKGNLKVGKSAESQVEMSKPMSFYVGVVAGLGGFLALRSYFQNQE